MKTVSRYSLMEEQPQPQETKESVQQTLPFEQQQEEQPEPMPDGAGFMMPDETLDDLPWK